MFKASVDGELYDPHRWGQYFKPVGSNFSFSNQDSDMIDSEPVVSKPIMVATKHDLVQNDHQDDHDNSPLDVDTAQVTAPEGKKNVNDILTMIRNRNQNK